jgi:hypothetical protein
LRRGNAEVERPKTSHRSLRDPAAEHLVRRQLTHFGRKREREAEESGLAGV